MLKAHPKKLLAECADCQATIQFDEQPLLGEFVYCSECDATLEVSSLRPLKLTLAYEDDLEDDLDVDDLYWDEDEDWDDMPIA